MSLITSIQNNDIDITFYLISSIFHYYNNDNLNI